MATDASAVKLENFLEQEQSPYTAQNVLLEVRERESSSYDDVVLRCIFLVLRCMFLVFNSIQRVYVQQLV